MMALGFWVMVTDEKKVWKEGRESADESNYKREGGLRGMSLELLLVVGGRDRVIVPF
jgi:hypothetical protein